MTGNTAATTTTTTAATVSAATLHEAAGRIGALPSRIQAMHPDFRVCGPAFPLRCAPGDNLALHHALYAARAGDVLVAEVGDGQEYGYWGEILSVAAQARDLGGLVINGGVRDRVALASVGFPVFADRVCIRGTVKDPDSPAALGCPVRLGDVTVRAGDLVVGDADGVVVIPADRVEQALRDSDARDRREADIMAALRAGSSTLELLDLPALGPGASTSATGSPQRRPVNVPGLGHAGAPFPVAVRSGRLVLSSAIHGKDPETGELPDTIEAQAAGVFDNVRRTIEAAGGLPGHIVKVVVFAHDAAAAREAVKQPWTALFPDPDDRPVRHTLTAPLPAGFLLQAEFIATLDATTETIA
jgi:4-hydroxy-4-methyl-2-oxoglutarate aldolase